MNKLIATLFLLLPLNIYAGILSPTADVPGSSAAVSWTAEQNVNYYWLQVYDDGKKKDYGYIDQTSQSVKLPADGSSMKIKLWMKDNSGRWHLLDSVEFISTREQITLFKFESRVQEIEHQRDLGGVTHTLLKAICRYPSRDYSVPGVEFDSCQAICPDNHITTGSSTNGDFAGMAVNTHSDIFTAFGVSATHATPAPSSEQNAAIASKPNDKLVVTVNVFCAG